ASASLPAVANGTNSTSTPSRLPSSRPRSTAMPVYSVSECLVTSRKLPKLIPTRSLPVGVSSDFAAGGGVITRGDSTRALLDLQVRRLDDLSHALDLRAHHLAEFLRRVGRDLRALLAESLLHLGQRDGLQEGGAKLVRDRLRGRLRGEQ